jgi:hypothetical protein
MKRILVIVALMMAFSAFASADTVVPMSIGDSTTFFWTVPDTHTTDTLGGQHVAYDVHGYATASLLDCCVIGDRFEIYDNGVLLGETSAPFPGYSFGSFALVGGGLHHLEIYVSEFAASTINGAGTLSITRAVPEPGTLALLGTGLLGFGFRRRRKI